MDGGLWKVGDGAGAEGRVGCVEAGPIPLPVRGSVARASA